MNIAPQPNAPAGAVLSNGVAGERRGVGYIFLAELDETGVGGEGETNDVINSVLAHCR